MLETDNYNKFKSDILQLAKIDLNSYKEKQMRRRINTLITKNNVKTYDAYVALLRTATEKFAHFLERGMLDRRRTVFSRDGSLASSAAWQYQNYCHRY